MVPCWCAPTAMWRGDEPDAPAMPWRNYATYCSPWAFVRRAIDGTLHLASGTVRHFRCRRLDPLDSIGLRNEAAGGRRECVRRGGGRGVRVADRGAPPQRAPGR